MSKDLVTYYGQTDLIDQFVEKYGPSLEQLDRETKALLQRHLPVNKSPALLKTNNHLHPRSTTKAGDLFLWISRITLAYYVFVRHQSSNFNNYSVLEAARDALYVRFIFDDVPQGLRDICLLLNGLTPNEGEIILDALQHQLHCGNAQIAMS